MILHDHRRRSAFVLATAVVLALAGCSGTPGTAPSPSGPASVLPDSTSPSPTMDDGVAVDPPSTPVPPAEKGQADVSVVITSASGADGISVVALVEGIAEDDGLCTLTADSSGIEVVASGPGHGSVSSVSCADGLEIPLDQLHSGDWSVTVSYESDAYAGVSAAVSVEVA